MLVVKSPPANAGDIRDMGSIPESGRSPGEGHGNPLQYSSPVNPLNRGAWRATVHRVSKSWTWLKWQYAPNNSVTLTGQKGTLIHLLFFHVAIRRHFIALWRLIYFPNILASQKENLWIESILQMVNIITLDFSKVFFTCFEWVNILLWGNRSWVKFLPDSLLGMPSKYAELPGIYISKYLPCQWVHTVEKSHSASSPENLVRDDTFRYDCHFNLYVSSSVTNMKKS